MALVTDEYGPWLPVARHERWCRGREETERGCDEVDMLVSLSDCGVKKKERGSLF